MRDKRVFGFQMLAVLLMLLILETFSFWRLRNEHSAFPFFINMQQSTEINDAQKIGFNEIHPLWGWNMSDEVLRSHGYESTNSVIKLHTQQAADTSLRIFITGGSTSDIVLDKDNWPVALHRLMTDSGIPHTIYVGAVGGFNSAQEYLRLIEQGLELKPHIHISYSGANETGDFGFVTEYERDFYTHTLNSSKTSFLLPNTIYLFKTKFLRQKSTLELAKPTEHQTADRFIKNVKLMHALAIYFGYQYIGILQPLNGIGNHNASSAISFNKEYLEDYKKYYPTMQEFATKHPEVMVDYTSVFDDVKKQMFVDDCHLNDEGNRLIAIKVLASVMLIIDKQ